MSKILSKNIFFKNLTEKDVTDRYVFWLNDQEINRYLEVRHIHQTTESCINFVKLVNSDSSQNLFGIFLIENGEHIGNIKLGYINSYHRRGQLSLFIGEKKYRGKGYALEAIKAITEWGFRDLGLEKIEAGCCEQNIASHNLFLKAGYQQEGFFRNHALIDGKRVGSHWFGILPNEFSK